MPNDLIYKLSLLGEIKLEQFNELLNEVSIEEKNGYIIKPSLLRPTILRILESLGYCEVDYAKRRIIMCPPSLARLPGAGMPRVALVGARSPELLAKLRQLVKEQHRNANMYLKQQKRFSLGIPPSVYIEADSVDTLENIASGLRIKSQLETPASYLLSAMSESSQTVYNSLEFRYMGWDNENSKIFDTNKLKFLSNPSRIDTGLVDIIDKISSQHSFFFYKGEQAAEIAADFGRYVSLEHDQRNILTYNAQTWQLAVASGVPLPEMLAKSLAMCSGLPPSSVKNMPEGIEGIPGNYPLDVYYEVDERVAASVASKVGQTLHKYDFKINQHGEVA